VRAGQGSSVLVESVGAGTVRDKPADWAFGIFGANNVTMVKITALQILPESPAGFSVEITSPALIDTKNPMDDDVVIMPKKDFRKSECSVIAGEKTAASLCYQYISVIYADYKTTPNAKVLIYTSLKGKNRWYIFGPSSNEYRDSLTLTLLGDDNHGWFPAKGELVTRTGVYDMPAL
jgi:hypothetical protein